MASFMMDLTLSDNNAMSSPTTQGSRKRMVGSPTSVREALVHHEDMLDSTMEGVLSGFHFVWSPPSTMQAFVDAANELSRDASSCMPTWISQPRGGITRDGLQRDLLYHVSELGGGLQLDSQLVTPNTSVQAYNICRRLGHIEMHPFMQQCMAQLPPDAHVASLMRLFEDPHMNACPVYFVAPPTPFRQLFF